MPHALKKAKRTCQSQYRIHAASMRVREMACKRPISTKSPHTQQQLMCLHLSSPVKFLPTANVKRTKIRLIKTSKPLTWTGASDKSLGPVLPTAEAVAPGGGGSGRVVGVPTTFLSLRSTNVVATDSLVKGPPEPAAAAAAPGPAAATTAAPPCSRERRRPEKLGGVVVLSAAWRWLGGRRGLEGLLVHRRERSRTMLLSVPRRLGGGVALRNADAVDA